MQHLLDDFTYAQLNALVKKCGGKDGVLKVLSGEWIVGEPAKVSKPKRSTKKTDTAIDTIIRVDRSVRPVYPDWADQKWISHEKFLALEKTGPAEYGLDALEQYLYGKQKTSGRETGNRIYDHLRSGDMLESCTSLQDLQAIQQLGIYVFRKHFASKAVFGWKSVVRDRRGHLLVPYLIGGGGRVELSWGWLGGDWDGGYPAARFAS